MVEEIAFSSSWPAFFASPSKDEGESDENPAAASTPSPSIYQMCRELFGTNFAAPSMIPLIHQQYSASTDADDGSQACTVHGSLAATTAVRTMDDRRYPDSVCPSVYSERRLPMGSTISVISDPTHMQSDDASRLDCSPSRRSRHPFRRNYSQRRRPVAVAVGFDALEDGGGRTVVITPGQGKTPPRIRESPSSFSSPHRSVVVDHKRSLPSPAPESVPYLPELRLNGASRRVE